MQVSDSFARMFVSARNGIYVDIYANEYSSYDGHVYNVASGHVDPFPVALIQPLVNVEFEGGVLPAPNDPDALLDLRYGSDWRTKFKRQAYEVRLFFFFFLRGASWCDSSLLLVCPNAL